LNTAPLLEEGAWYGKAMTAVVIDAATGVKRSWRVELLPFLGLDELYQQYRPNEAWDSEANRRVLQQMPEAFRSRGWTPGSTTTRFMFPVGTGTLTEPGPAKPFWWIAGRDGLDGTICLVESPTTEVHWTKPEDLHVDLGVASGPSRQIGADPKSLGPTYRLLASPRGLNLGGLVGREFAAASKSGDAFFVARDIETVTLRRLLCWADGERIDASEIARKTWVTRPVAQMATPPTARGNAEAPSPRSASAQSPYVNTLGMKFVPVPIPGLEKDRLILFSIYETRVKDFAAFAEKTPGLKTGWKDLVFGSSSQQPEHPVVSVPWNDAQGFCEWRTKQDREGHHIGPNDRYRLPTDEEWSWAVGIGSREDPKLPLLQRNNQLDGTYPWGTGWPPPPRFGNFLTLKDSEKIGLPPGLPGYDDGFPSIAPVGSFPPNWLGIYDLEGNVSEYCADFYGEQHPLQKYRVVTVRGGCFLSHDELSLKSAARRPEMEYGTYYCGFRCVLDLGSEGDERESAERQGPH
jgi:hypothetical protein